MPHYFTTQTVEWFAGISENNTKAFYAEHKDMYLAAVREPFHELLTALAAEWGGTPYVFRVNRDVRFSKDKRPYKTNISGYLAGRPATHSATYIELSADSLMAATGYHVMEADQLERFRRTLTGEMAEEWGRELQNILETLESAGYLVDGDRLKTMPRGIAKDAANGDLLRWKSLTMRAQLPIEEALHFQKACNFISSTWKAGRDLSAWLDRHVGPSLLQDVQ
jgi:uncharacterized protein (TIGR02453 family)